MCTTWITEFTEREVATLSSNAVFGLCRVNKEIVRRSISKAVKDLEQVVGRFGTAAAGAPRWRDGLGIGTGALARRWHFFSAVRGLPASAKLGGSMPRLFIGVQALEKRCRNPGKSKGFHRPARASGLQLRSACRFEISRSGLTSAVFWGLKGLVGLPPRTVQRTILPLVH